jgi:hypothetical protein
MKKKQKITLGGRTWQAIRAYDYRSAAEKIAFTAIGLLLALWINNWNEDCKKQVAERAILAEMRVALKQDLEDVRVTCEGFEYRIKGCNVGLANLTDTAVMTDSLCQYLQYVWGYSFLLANTSAYETLKSRGFDAISDDSLRNEIAYLYDVQYDGLILREETLIDFYKNQTTPYYLRYFKWGASGLRPLDWEVLRRDQLFANLLINIRYQSSSTLEDYRVLEKRINRLIERIDGYLAG